MSYYSALAPFYDGFMRGFPYDQYASLCEDVFRAARCEVTSVLDLACGTGTLSCLLAARGYDVVACDEAPEMLSAALAKRTGDNPLFICQSMEELDLFGTVSAAVCSLDGINHVPGDRLHEVFRRVRLFLEPGGVFLFDVNSEEKLKALDGESFIDETGDALCVWRTEYTDSKCDFFTDIFAPEGPLWRRWSAEHSEYVHSPELLEKLLLESGFDAARRIDVCLPNCVGREFWLAELRA